MKAEIIGIGTEILLGQIVNTNSAHLSRKLAEIGIDVYHHTAIGDNKKRLYDSIKTALIRSDIVITTGGLGPTVDDVTLEAVTKISEKPLILQKKIARLIREHFKKRHIKMPENNLRQAYIPKDAIWLGNNTGTAPGLIIKINKKILIALPGPPREMIPMFDSHVSAYMKKQYKSRCVILSHTLKTTGLAESQLHDKVKGFMRLSGDTTVGIYAHPAQVDLKITSKAKNLLSARGKIGVIEEKIRKKLGNLIFGTDNQMLEENTLKLLRNRTIAIAESCTGGLIASRITDVPGASKNLLCSIVAYSNKSKTELLDVSYSTIKKHGAVSSQTAKDMAVNIRNLSGANIGISTTGIAGPAGATNKKPVGLVYIGLSTELKTFVKKYYFTGTREMIKFRTSQAALDMIRHHLLG
ncbi:competence/damage-inducible protein A [bacterium]|nr:MAG: competence/damage-inducible protein A [bacterium]